MKGFYQIFLETLTPIGDYYDDGSCIWPADEINVRYLKWVRNYDFVEDEPKQIDPMTKAKDYEIDNNL